MNNLENKLSRLCPICNKEIFYSSKSTMNRAGNKPCQSCFISSLWSREDSPLRKEETRLKRNSSISKRRKDPNSAYNTNAYKEKQSIAKKSIRTTLPSYTSDEYIKKQSDTLKKVWQTEEYRSKRLSPETLESFSLKMKKVWEEKYSEFISSFIKSWDNDERREAARQRFNTFLESDDFKNKLWGNQKQIRVSKLELKIQNQLEKLGYLHSSKHKKYFNRYLPDFLNEQNKSIIEIYGDYWHCNPSHKIYGDATWFHPKLKMYSQDKWASDFMRNEFISSQGYKIYVLWESDIRASNYNLENFNNLIT